LTEKAYKSLSKMSIPEIIIDNLEYRTLPVVKKNPCLTPYDYPQIEQMWLVHYCGAKNQRYFENSFQYFEIFAKSKTFLNHFEKGYFFNLPSEFDHKNLKKLAIKTLGAVEGDYAIGLIAADFAFHSCIADQSLDYIFKILRKLKSHYLKASILA
jgi:hypothetical protein